MQVHLLDGTYEIFRHYFGLPADQRPEEDPVRAARGVVLSVLSLLEEGVTHIGVATDHVIESFRNDLWPGYKSSAGVPRTLLDQFVPLAEEAGLDLVEVAPNADPPVCKILDFGKYKYEEQKKKNEARKKQKVIEVKEIKLRPGIDTHDYEVKMRAVHRFLEEGDKVKVTMRFRGREMAHQELGVKVLDRVKADLDAIAKVESAPKLEGRQMIMVVAPK